MKSTRTWASFGNRFATTLGCLVCFLAIPWPAIADTSWNVGVSGGSNGIEGFNISIGDYYHVPEREVIVIHARGIDEEELPVVFFLAQRAHVPPEAIVNLRLGGMSWMAITLHFGLSPDIYYVPIDIHRYGPPPGHYYGYYHRYPHGGWGRNILHDRDIVNQVNLRFLSEHYRYAPEQVMRYRSEGRRFPIIERDIRYQKQRPNPWSGQESRPHGYDQNKGPGYYHPVHQDHLPSQGPMYYHPKGPRNGHGSTPVNYQPQRPGSDQGKGHGKNPWDNEQGQQARR